MSELANSISSLSLTLFTSWNYELSSLCFSFIAKQNKSFFIFAQCFCLIAAQHESLYCEVSPVTVCAVNKTLPNKSSLIIQAKISLFEPEPCNYLRVLRLTLSVFEHPENESVPTHRCIKPSINCLCGNVHVINHTKGHFPLHADSWIKLHEKQPLTVSLLGVCFIGDSHFLKSFPAVLIWLVHVMVRYVQRRRLSESVCAGVLGCCSPCKVIWILLATWQKNVENSEASSLAAVSSQWFGY